MEIVKSIAALVGCILSLISLITICTKGGRSFIINLFKKNTKELHDEALKQSEDIQIIKEQMTTILDKMSGVEEVSMQQCRDTIKDIYYKYRKEKELPLYERKTADKTYKIYTEKFHGNSYAALLYGEITKWNIEAGSDQEMDEE